MIPLISEHDSWISVDPIIGCPARCAYCFLGPVGLTQSAPHIRASPKATVDALSLYIKHGPDSLRSVSIPNIACIGNNTDIFMSAENRNFLFDYVRCLRESLPELITVLITKTRLTSAWVRELDSIGQRCIIFLSQSFLSWHSPAGNCIEPGVSKPDDTACSAALLASSKNLTPMHFWRPLMSLNLPTEAAAERQLRLVRDAGCRASVAIGLKHGPDLRKRFSTADNLLLLGSTELEAMSSWTGFAIDEELFPSQLTLRALGAGKALGFPVFLNTSCAIAFALNSPESLGTFRGSMRATYCEPAICPVHQRARCADVRDRKPALSSHKVDAEERVARWLLAPAEAVRWDPQASLFLVNSRLDQNLQCSLHHATGCQVHPAVLGRSRAWVGTVSQGQPFTSSYGQVLEDTDYPFAGAIERLKTVTGLITPLQRANDHHADCFSRYYHVRRVASVAAIVQLMLSQSDEGDRIASSQRANARNETVVIEKQKIERLAWAHDLNRWPFAHNSEQGLFDQCENVRKYFNDHVGWLSDSEITDVLHLHKRQPQCMSLEAQIVLASDQAAGLIEDILFCITSLGLGPEHIPTIVQQFVEMPFDEGWFRQRLWGLRLEFMESTRLTFEGFIAKFDASVTATAAALVLRHISITSDQPLMSQIFRSGVASIKAEFLRPFLYPLANIRVGRGNLHRERVVVPLLELKGRDFAEEMMSLTDQDMVQLALDNHLITSTDVDDLYPDFDYIEREEPALLFTDPKG